MAPRARRCPSDVKILMLNTSVRHQILLSHWPLASCRSAMQAAATMVNVGRGSCCPTARAAWTVARRGEAVVAPFLRLQTCSCISPKSVPRAQVEEKWRRKTNHFGVEPAAVDEPSGFGFSLVEKVNMHLEITVTPRQASIQGRIVRGPPHSTRWQDYS